MLSNAKKLWLMKIGRGIGPSPSMSPSASPSVSPSSSPSASPSPSIIFDSTGSTFDRGDFTEGNAFFWSSLDLSPYAGTDLGSTPYYIEVLDGTGKKATGYIGAVGAGETLGSEMLTNGSFSVNTDSWSAVQCILASVAGGQSENCLEITQVSGDYATAYQGVFIPANQLIKSTGYVKSGTSGNENCGIGWDASGTPFPNGVSSGSWSQITQYRVGHLDGYPNLSKLTGTAGTMLFDEVSSKRVTDPPAIAVHIVSSLNGTTRDWASIESGFDPNDIASWTIWGF